MKHLFLALNLVLFSNAYGSFATQGEDYFSLSPSEPNQELVQPSDIKRLTQEIKRIVKQDFSVEILEEDRLNAFATFDDNDKPLIKITRGIIQHQLSSKNVLALLICHELGHFWGGFPKQFRGNSDLKSWSTAEGQADYYSIIMCAKHVHLNRAQTQYKNCESKSKCNELTEAALNLSKIYAEIKFWPYGLKVDDPDPTVVRRTELDHPNPQCRLDTMVAAIQCLKMHHYMKDTEIFYTCTLKENRQPSCWMAPSTFQDI